jgi:hypothetical protein
MQTLEEKRSFLFSTRLRFSPQVQHVREDAIDKILEQSLLSADSGVDFNHILRQAASLGEVAVITARDVKDSLGRLLARGRAISLDTQEEGGRFALSDITRIQLWQVQQEAENRFSRVCEKLFGDAQGPRQRYALALRDCLCAIFSRLGEAYVRVLKGDNRISDFVGAHTIDDAVRDCASECSPSEQGHVRAALVSFFNESDPDYASIKWNLAQNYYVAKALGLDPSGGLLSRELFAGAVFYLDTNVILPAIEPKTRDHHSAKMLVSACKEIGIEMRACQISIQQLRNVTRYNAELLPRVADQIPEATVPKVRNVFYALYREQVSQGGDFDPNLVFAHFYDPARSLSDLGVDLFDDPWFTDLEGNANICAAAQALNESLEARHRRQKRKNSALHDAALVLWVERERTSGTENTWVVTLDSSLSDTRWASGAEKPAAITLDALLQWLSPVVASTNGDFESPYSEAVKELLLPQENFFDLRDFLIFADIDWSCKELPAADVEGCIRSIRRELSSVDPTKPEGREILSHHISKYFADPGRTFRQEVERLEREKRDETATFAERLANAEIAERRAVAAKDSEIAEKERTIEALRQQVADIRRTADENVKRATEELSAERISRQTAEARRSAFLRLIVCCGFILLGEIIAGFVYLRLGEGSNWFKRVISGWPVFTAIFGSIVPLSWLAVGRSRLRTLGWPFDRLLRVEGSD